MAPPTAAVEEIREEPVTADTVSNNNNDNNTLIFLYRVIGYNLLKHYLSNSSKNMLVV